MDRRRHRIAIGFVGCAAIGHSVLGWADSTASLAQPISVSHWAVGVDAERWQLPGDETAGIAGLHLRRQVGAHLRWGVDSFAAVQGRRGGFITLGVGGEARYPLWRDWEWEVGASVSAGGGRGGHELSGGGLLLRETLGVGVPEGDWRWRLGVSHVDFPNGGTITGTQAYLGLERSFSGLTAAYGAPSGRYRVPESTDLLPSDVGVYVRQYRVRTGSLTDAGQPQANFGLIGAEWRGTVSGPWYAWVDAGGAARGQSNGYMEILGGAGVRLPVTTSWWFDAALGGGAGGGGAVDTGGGALWAVRLGSNWRLTDREVVSLGVERMRAPSGHLTVDGLSLGLRHRFGPDAPTSVPAGTDLPLEVQPVRVRVTAQTYRAANADWATRPIPDIGVLGVQADYDLSPRWYLTGQGLAAYRGQSGAYMTGLVGVGLHEPLVGAWQAEAEVLGGAAGGGGVAVASGAVGQINAGVGYETASGIGLHLSLGRLRALHGPFAAQIVGFSVSYRLALLTGAP
jgi:hypothetical protein